MRYYFIPLAVALGLAACGQDPTGPANPSHCGRGAQTAPQPRSTGMPDVNPSAAEG